jgi:hypothetical protein
MFVSVLRQNLDFKYFSAIFFSVHSSFMFDKRVFHIDLDTSNYNLHTGNYTLHTVNYTLHTVSYTLHTMYENLSRYMYCTCGFLGKFFNVSVKDPDFWGEIMSSPYELFLFSFKS